MWSIFIFIIFGPCVPSARYLSKNIQKYLKTTVQMNFERLITGQSNLFEYSHSIYKRNIVRRSFFHINILGRTQTKKNGQTKNATTNLLHNLEFKWNLKIMFEKIKTILNNKNYSSFYSLTINQPKKCINFRQYLSITFQMKFVLTCIIENQRSTGTIKPKFSTVCFLYHFHVNKKILARHLSSLIYLLWMKIKSI